MAGFEINLNSLLFIFLFSIIFLREIWQSIFIPSKNLQKESDYFVTNLTNLKQNTQYAYYVRTQLSKDDLMNVTQGQSTIKYFTTNPDRPRPPIVRTKDSSSSSITLEWHPSTPELELIEKYIIDVYTIHDDVNEIDKRNYCKEPRVSEIDKTNDTVKPKEVICCDDERAYLEFFQRKANQTCGESDPTCEATFKFILF